MDAFKSELDNQYEDDSLDRQAMQIIKARDLSPQRQKLQVWLAKNNADLLDYAAALLVLLQQPKAAAAVRPPASSLKEPKQLSGLHCRTVRYRLNVGSQQQVNKEQIQSVLIEESGVDIKRIGKIDIRDNYTVVELPDGMPADIFQLLFEATIEGRQLAIKRIKSNRRTGRNRQNP